MNSTSIDISTILEWFKRAIPEPTDKNRAVQIGCHFEEVGEMLTALWLDDSSIETLAFLYKRERTVAADGADRKELLDSLCDQIVTAIGVAHMFKLDICGALNEVNRSNWSKFVDGQPVFNEHGKIAKGENYTPPDLAPFVGDRP